jgi:hypothetical protein
MERKESKLQDILGRLRPEDLDQVERRVLVARETFQCPSTVATTDESENVLVRFYAHTMQMKYGDNVGAVYSNSKSMALHELDHMVGGSIVRWDLQREAVYGPRSMIQIVDYLAEKMGRFDLEMYVDRMCCEAHVDWGDMYQMAEEMVAQFGTLLSLHPGFHYSFLVVDRKKFQNTVLNLALQLRSLHDKWVLGPKETRRGDQ